MSTKKATKASNTYNTYYIGHGFRGRQAIISLVLRWIMSKPK